MELKGESLSANFVFPVTSSESSQDTVIDLSLSMIADTADYSAEESKNNLGAENEDLTKNPANTWTQFRKLREEQNHKEGGWVKPFNLGKALDDELRSVNNLKQDQASDLALVSESLDESRIKDLLNSVQSFKDNSDAFKEYLLTLREEVQNLPLFQGAISSLNTTIISQSENIKELKNSNDKALANVSDKQDRLESLIEKNVLNNSYEEKFKEVNQSIDSLSKLVNENSTTLQKVDSVIQGFDSSKLHGNLETIYQAVKKSIEDNREAFKKLLNIANVSTAEHVNTQNIEIIDSVSGLSRQLEQLVHQVSKINSVTTNLKKKQTASLVLTMLGMGVLIGAVFNLLSR